MTQEDFTGLVTSVVTDGSVTYTVTFPVVLTAIEYLNLQIVGGTTWGGYFIDTNVFALTTSGFKFTVTGGKNVLVPAPVNVYWRVSGTVTTSTVTSLPSVLPGGSVVAPNTTPSYLVYQEYTGNVGSVVADGSVVYTVSFPATGFVNIESIITQVVGGATPSGYTLLANVFNLTDTGFQFMVTGGLATIPVTLFWLVGGTINIQYTNADWANRVILDLPNGWFPGGGVLYNFFYSLMTNFPFHNTQIDYQTNQVRIGSASGDQLDAISLDYFGTGSVALPRLMGESDAAYRVRILAQILETKSTIAAIQRVVNNYIAQNNPPYVSAVVFDLMTNPQYAQALGITAPEFVIDLVYQVTSDFAWFLNSDPTGYLGYSTYLTAIQLIPPPDAGLDAAIREIKAEGTVPVYTVLNGV